MVIDTGSMNTLLANHDLYMRTNSAGIGGELKVNGVEPEDEVIVNHKSPGYDCVLCNLIGPCCYW